MQTYVQIFVVLLLSSLSHACTASSIYHEPRNAIAVVEKFANRALVEKDFAAALEFAAKEKETLNQDALEVAIRQIQGAVPFPESVRATAYEIPPGQRQILVYVEGKTENSLSYYRIVAVGDSSSGYTVMELYRSDASFPKGPLQEAIH